MLAVAVELVLLLDELEPVLVAGAETTGVGMVASTDMANSSYTRISTPPLAPNARP